MQRLSKLVSIRKLPVPRSPGQCHGAAHEFGRYALSFDLLCDGQTVQDDVWGLVEPRAVDFGIGRFAVEDDSPVSDDESCVST